MGHYNSLSEELYPDEVTADLETVYSYNNPCKNLYDKNTKPIFWFYDDLVMILAGEKILKKFQTETTSLVIFPTDITFSCFHLRRQIPE